MSEFKPMSREEAHALYYGHYEMEDTSDPMIRPFSEEEGWVVQMGVGYYKNTLPDAPYEDAKLLAHAKRALKTIWQPPAPQVIRTAEELEALDRDVPVMDGYERMEIVGDWLDEDGKMMKFYDLRFPIVVIATGEQVREARKALEGDQ